MSRPPLLPRSTSSSAASAASPLRAPPRGRGRPPEPEHQARVEQAADAAADPEPPEGVGLRRARREQRRPDHARLKSPRFRAELLVLGLIQPCMYCLKHMSGSMRKKILSVHQYRSSKWLCFTVYCRVRGILAKLSSFIKSTEIIFLYAARPFLNSYCAPEQKKCSFIVKYILCFMIKRCTRGPNCPLSNN